MLSEALIAEGLKLVSGGTDNHLMLLDLRGTGVTGKELEHRLDAVHITANKNNSAVSDVIKSTVAYDCATGEILEITDHHFGYRESIYMENSNLICLEATFSLSNAPEGQIREKMQENMRSRKEKQPLEYPSAGSYFKRPKDSFAGKLIEDCGLKGLRVGDAEVSTKHAGFIINRGKATANDILELEEKIKEIVMSRFGILLEREVELIK